MKRAERHHLKQDEFVHWLDQAIAWGQDNKKNLVNGVFLAVGASLLLAGAHVYRTRQTETSQALLTSALEQYHGVVLSPSAPAPPPGVASFATEREKYESAVAALDNVADNYGGYDAGRQARYYVGLCRAELSEAEAAMQALEDVRQGDRDLLYYLASRALAELKSESGDRAGASEIYRGLVEDDANPLPKDHLLFELAKNEERAGNVDEARRYYARMLAEHPNSQLRNNAMTRSETLELESEGA